MNRKLIQSSLVSFVMVAGISQILAAVVENTTQLESTPAGKLDFSIIKNITHPAAFHKIHLNNREGATFQMDDGSLWSVAKAHSIKGWDPNSNLFITQNHAHFSIARYAIVNQDLKIAVPVSLERGPRALLRN